MRDRELKALVISALRPVPDFSALPSLRRCSSAQLGRLLRWLDQSGLALYLCSKLQQHKAMDALPQEFSRALEQRLSSNHARALDMLQEFQRLVASFQTRGACFCVLKGFTLIPEFCPSPFLRHQTDFDFLLAPESIDDAKRALESCGYHQEESFQSGELIFATPLHHVPSPNDDIYALPRHREVDLRISLQQDEHGVSIDMPHDCLDRIQTRNLQDISFPSLAADDMFSLQVTHAFKHLLGSWVRLSWLLEIGHFIDARYADTGLWHSVRSRAGNGPIVRNAFGLIISLSNTLFPRPIPGVLHDWCLRPLPSRIETWVAQFGFKSAVSGLDGGKLTLFVHREFISDPDFWNSYVKSRIFPVRGRTSIGRVATANPGVRIKAVVSQWLHAMRRVAFHARELASLPVEALRWKRALRSLKKQSALVTTASD